MYDKALYISKVLNNIAENLDISDTKFLDAKNKYEAVGNWLGKEESLLIKYNPEIYPQGSFRLGTVVKPIGKDEYDIDLVCFLNNLNQKNITQYELKKIVGDRLKENEIYKNILKKEGRRCWTLEYANEFHMDILPSIADEQARMSDFPFQQEAILITDKEKMKNNEIDWPKSNPKGYTDWFFERQVKVSKKIKKSIAENTKVNIEDVPDYKVKTPLQRAIQILKRHRDIFFSDKENKPISIIITTLSANLYSGQDDVFNTIYDILLGINEEILIKDGKYCIPNPVNDSENFADKWNENLELPKNFLNWLNDAKDIFLNKIIQKEDFEEINTTIRKSLDFSPIEKVIQPVNSKPYYVKKNDLLNNKPWQNEK